MDRQGIGSVSVLVGFVLNFVEFDKDGFLSSDTTHSSMYRFFTKLFETLMLTFGDVLVSIGYWLADVTNNLQLYPGLIDAYIKIHPTGNFIYLGTVIILIGMVLGAETKSNTSTG